MDRQNDRQQSFYRWVDAEGRLHVVSSLDAVPVNERGRAEHVSLNSATAVATEHRRELPSSWRFDLGSFGLGFGSALLLALLFRLLPSGWRGVTKVAVVFGVGLLLSGLYLGAVRRATGQGDAAVLASPRALIEDAKAAVQKLDARQKQQEEELKQLEAEAR